MGRWRLVLPTCSSLSTRKLSSEITIRATIRTTNWSFLVAGLFNWSVLLVCLAGSYSVSVWMVCLFCHVYIMYIVCEICMCKMLFFIIRFLQFSLSNLLHRIWFVQFTFFNVYLGHLFCAVCIVQYDLYLQCFTGFVQFALDMICFEQFVLCNLPFIFFSGQHVVYLSKLVYI